MLLELGQRRPDQLALSQDMRMNRHGPRQQLLPHLPRLLREDRQRSHGGRGLDGLAEQDLLRPEVPEDGHFVDPGRLGDPAGGRAAPAMFGKELGGDFEQR